MSYSLIYVRLGHFFSLFRIKLTVTQLTNAILGTDLHYIVFVHHTHVTYSILIHSSQFHVGILLPLLSFQFR